MFKTITTGLVITEEDLIKFVPGYDAEYGQLFAVYGEMTITNFKKLTGTSVSQMTSTTSTKTLA